MSKNVWSSLVPLTYKALGFFVILGRKYMKQYIKRFCLTHIIQCSNGWRELFQEQWIEGLCTTKINNLNHIHISDNDIVWFDIQMQDSPAVQVVQTLKYLYDIRHNVVL